MSSSNGRCRWFDLDLPDSIALRRKFFTDSERRVQLAASVVDATWMERVRQTGGPYFFVAEAVFIYLEADDVRSALAAIASAFPDAQVAFDTGGRYMVENQHKHDVMKSMAARFRWACDDPWEIERWGLGLSLRESCTFLSAPAPLQKHVPFALRVLGPVLFRRQIGSYRMNLFDVAAAS